MRRVILMLTLMMVMSLASAAEPVRVAAARKDKLDDVKAAFDEAKVAYPPKEVLLRAFKSEQLFELWAGNGKSEMVLIKSWPICASSGVIGPKRQQGDLQVPEGFYDIDKLNPVSSFHLSMHVNYPNKADRVRNAGVKDLGGDIMVHGNCVTIGCIPIEDDPIEFVYLVLTDAKKATTPIQIFPRKLDAAGLEELLKAESTASDAVKALWRQLAEGERIFSETRRPPKVTIDGKGQYVVKPR